MTEHAKPIEPLTPASAVAPALPPSGPVRSWGRIFIGVVLFLCLISAISLWQRLGKIQGQLAKQTQEANQTSQDAKLLARNATDASAQSTAKLAVLEAKLNELVVQKAQIDDMLQSLSRSRVENQVLDIEASLILAQQQAQLTGSVQPLIAALMSAQQRMSRSPSPRLVPLENAMRRDIERLRGANVLDTPAVLVRIDELVRWADELPLSGAMQSKDGSTAKSGKAAVKGTPTETPSRWQEALASFKRQWEDLVRVQRIEHPESALLSPEQGFFVRENLKLKLLNARMGVLARQFSSAKADLAVARQTLERYFDVQSKSGQAALGGLEQAQAQLNSGALPGIDETLNGVAALTGRK